MYGLVLQGGGTKGSYHIGVWKALREMNIGIGAVTGTSIGALNGALIAMDKYEEALELWENIKVNDVIDAESETFRELVNLDVTYDKIDKYLNYFKRIMKDKGLDTGPLRALVERFLDEDALRTSPIDFGLVTVSLTDRKPLELFKEDIPKGKMAEYLLASAFLPGFKPEAFDGKRFIDGGVYDNLPINLIAQKGYKDIIAVEMDSIGIKQRVRDKTLNIIRIQPSGDIGMMLEFDPDVARRNIQMGYLDTMKAMGQYGGREYYFEALPDESYFFHTVAGLSDQDIMKMAEGLGLKDGQPKRVLFEKIIPEIADMFNMNMTDGYREITLTMMEYLGNLLGIDRLRPYKYNEFEALVMRRVFDYDTGYIDYRSLPNFIKRTALVKYTMKDEILVNWAKIIMDSYLHGLEDKVSSSPKDGKTGTSVKSALSRD